MPSAVAMRVLPLCKVLHNGNYAGLPIMLRNGAEPQADGLEPPCSPA